MSMLYFRNKPIGAISDGGSSYTEGDGIDITNNEISVDTTFTEASTRANITSDENFATILGKIKKFFTDLKTVAFSGAAADVTYGSATVEDALDDVNDELTTKYIKCRFVEQTVTFPANTSNISISFATELADIDSSSILMIIGVNIGSFGFPYIGNDGYTIIYSINKGTKTVVVNNTAGAWTNYKFRCLVFYT